MKTESSGRSTKGFRYNDLSQISAWRQVTKLVKFEVSILITGIVRIDNSF